MDEQAVRELAAKAHEGDGDALGALFDAFQPDVLRLCTRLLGSEDEARDAAQETFLRARNGIGRYQAERPFRPWLLAVASHHAIDRLRRRRAERRLFAADADPDAPGAQAAEGGPSPLQRELAAAARRELLAAIDALPDRYRAPIVLRYYADLDHDEIAVLLGVSRGQVATLLLRGRRRLRAQLAARGGPAPAGQEAS